MTAELRDDDLSSADSGAGTPSKRHSRRLEDKLLIAFHHACDVNDLEIAGQVLRVLEIMLARRPAHPDGNRRRNMEAFVAAHERMWHIRHRDG